MFRYRDCLWRFSPYSVILHYYSVQRGADACQLAILHAQYGFDTRIGGICSMFSSKAINGYLRLTLAAVLCCALLTPLNATAQGEGYASRGISSGQAANIARSATGGKVLSVSPSGDYFRVRILKNNGVVTNVLVARETGQIVR